MIRHGTVLKEFSPILILVRLGKSSYVLIHIENNYFQKKDQLQIQMKNYLVQMMLVEEYLIIFLFNMFIT